MTEELNVIESYRTAKRAKKKKQYLLAARLYRLCALYYENGKLGPFDRQVQNYGETAPRYYNACKSKLSPQEQEMLNADDAKYTAVDDRYTMRGRYFIWSWRDLVKEEWEKIDHDELQNLYEEINKRHKALDLLLILKAFVFKKNEKILNSLIS